VATSRPAVFTRLDLGAAYERSLSEQRLLLVDATAPWCGPCRLMDRTTWLDAGVVAWIHAHAIAFQLDVDAHGAAAKKLNVTAMPTVIVYRDGEELDRVVGFQKPQQMLSWLDGLTRGVTSLEIKRAEIAASPDDRPLRLQYARMLEGAGRLDDATAEYVWLCKHAHTFFADYVSDLHRLVRAHPPARTAIVQIRDELSPTGAPSLAALHFWLLLNDILGEARRSLQWFDDCYSSLTNQHEVSDVVETLIGPLLVGAHRWRDVRALYGKRLWRIPVRELVTMWKGARRRLR
jgi:thiol-disulfide isomerase/thioredoxin